MDTRPGPWPEARITEAVRRSLEETDLPGAFTGLVRQLLLSDTDDWNVCCGDGCDPCVNDLSRAADRAWEILESG